MGTSVPRRSNELKGTPPSPVIEYKLSPEELDKIQGKPIPKSQTKPIEFRAKTSIPKNEEDVKDMPKVNKADYLELRVKGVSKKDAAKKLGTSLASLESYWIPKQWGIKSDASEEIEIARFKESRQEKKQEAPPAPPVAEKRQEEAQSSEPIPVPVITEKPAEPEKESIPILPVQITQEQAAALKLILSHKSADEIVLRHSQTFIITRERWLEDLDSLNDLSLDDMIRAVYFGYEIKRTPEEQLLHEFKQAEAMYGAQEGLVYRTGLQIAAEILGHKVLGVNA